MNEKNGSDTYHKRPSSAEVEVAALRADLRHHERRDQEDLAYRTVLMQKLDRVIDDGHEARKQLALGLQRFESLETKQKETTTALTAVQDRVEAVEKRQASVVHKIVGGGMVASFIIGALALIKDWIPFFSKNGPHQ